jgi:4-hydroxyphenylacetate 3-monooxygenase
MAINTGREYIERIDRLQNEVWYDGERLEGNISKHPVVRGVLKSQAELYDLQHDQSLFDTLTYLSPKTNEPVGTSYLQPKTIDDLIKRRKATEEWAKKTAGMMGRSPDYMNTVLMSLASSTSLLDGKENCFPDHLKKFYEYVRENDLSLTHTFINPQNNRSRVYYEDSDEVIAAKVIDKNEEGIVIQGAKLLATQGGITDEILVVSAGGIIDKALGFAFAIPSNTKGLRFICRESFVNSPSTFNHPLNSRFEEMDTVVVFDEVIVPWERVFYFDQLEVSNTFLKESSFRPFALHQVTTRRVIKTEFILGLVELLVETINICEYQHVQLKVAEILVALETIKSLLLRSEFEAETDQWGVMRPNEKPLQVASCYYPSIYPRFSEIIQLLGASGLVSIPTEKDFGSDIKKDLDLYLQGATKNAQERVQLFRLAWDVSMSSFGSRQTLYEQFFFGDPIRLSSALYMEYDKQPYVERVLELLEK